MNDELSKLAAAAALFRESGGRPWLSWPMVVGGALFGCDGVSAFFAGSVDLPDGWVVPDSLDLAAWADAAECAFRTGSGLRRAVAVRMEKEAIKGATGWRHVTETGCIEALGVPRLWELFRRDVVPLSSEVAVDPKILVRFKKAARMLGRIGGGVRLTGSRIPQTDIAPIHVFIGGKWCGVVMPMREEPAFESTIPAPQRFAGVTP